MTVQVDAGQLFSKSKERMTMEVVAKSKGKRATFKLYFRGVYMGQYLGSIYESKAK